jgi:hypothetical protein
MANYTNFINFMADAELLRSSGKLRFGRYLRNAGSKGWVLAWRGYITLYKNIYLLHHSDCASVNICYVG